MSWEEVRGRDCRRKEEVPGSQSRWEEIKGSMRRWWRWWRRSMSPRVQGSQGLGYLKVTFKYELDSKECPSCSMYVYYKIICMSVTPVYYSYLLCVAQICPQPPTVRNVSSIGQHRPSSHKVSNN